MKARVGETSQLKVPSRETRAKLRTPASLRAHSRSNPISIPRQTEAVIFSAKSSGASIIIFLYASSSITKCLYSYYRLIPEDSSRELESNKCGNLRLPAINRRGVLSAPSQLFFTFSTDIGSVLCLIACATGGTFLAGIGWVYLLYRDAKPFRFVGDEHRQLIEAPGVFHPVVFAGRCPTTGACRALADACKRLYFDGTHALFMGMVHNVPGKLMVDILHPPRFFALAFLDGACLSRFLQALASAVEASAHVSLISAIAKEARSLASDMRYSRDFDPKIHTQNGLPLS